MENKQTPIDYIKDNLFYPIQFNQLKRVLNEAEQMHKEQMIEFANKVLDNTVGDYDGDIELLKPLEDIYNETYNVKDN
jgi:hypothetical protein